MTSLMGVMKRINLISDLRARVKKACDCGFLHWHRVCCMLRTVEINSQFVIFGFSVAGSNFFAYEFFVLPHEHSYLSKSEPDKSFL